MLWAYAAIAGDAHKFFYELRAPKTSKFDPLTRVDLVADQSAVGTLLRLTKRREDGNFIIFYDSCLIFNGEERRAMVVTTKGQPSQVFRLTIPSSAKPAGWSKWQRPDYTENSDVIWTFVHDTKDHDRSTNIPPNCFEFRFRITEYKQ
jgi:hypothetical protein